jgi:hypothetical protein
MKSFLSKIATIVLLAAVLAPVAFARDDEAPHTLVSVTDLHFSGHGGPIVRGTSLGGEGGVLFGGRGGVIINDSLALGAGGCGLAYSGAEATFEGEERKVGFGYGGFMAEYYFFPKNLVFFSVGCLVGGGSVSDYSYRYEDGNAFFIVEPEVNAYVNVTRYFRLGTGVSYRYSNGIDLDGFDDEDFRGFSGSLLFDFGWF